MALVWPSDSSPFWLSLRIAGVATVIAGVLGVFAARALGAYRGPGRRLVDTFLLLPLVLPPTAVGFALLLLFGARGPLGRALRECCDLSVVFTATGATLAAAVAAFPIVYQACRGAFPRVDRRYEQAARAAGAGRERVFWRIVLPLARPGVVAGLLLAFARALGEFGATLLLAGNIPGVTRTMPIALFFDVEAGAFGEAAVWACLLGVVALTVVIAVRRTEPVERKVTRRTVSVAPPMPPSDADILVDIDVDLPDFRLEARVAGGKRLAILGPSGAGKSVLLLAIAGLVKPARGVIRLGGRTLLDTRAGIDLPPRERSLGFLFQHYALFPHLTVAKNIAFGILRDEEARVAELMAAFDLRGLEMRRPAELSGGQQQRVALARALAPRPSALLLDEPLVALDGPLRARLEAELATTLSTYAGPALYVTHRPAEAYRLCDDVAVLDGGRTVACGTRQSVFRRPPSVAVARLVGYRWIVPVTSVDSRHVLAWGVRLAVAEGAGNATRIAIRNGAFTLFPPPDAENRLPAWPVATRETAEGVAISWKLGASGNEIDGETELPTAQWRQLRDRPAPWTLAVAPEDIVAIP